MSTTSFHPARPRDHVRSLLVAQQQHAPGAVVVPRALQTPVIAALWCAILMVLVAGLALTRVRVPRVTPATVLVVPAAGGERPFGRTTARPVLLLPAEVAPFVRPGQLAAIDTGGVEPLVLSIASVEAEPVDLAEARRRYAGLASVVAAFRSPRIVARLDPCRDGPCLPLAPGAAFVATARLGTRSLASYAMPGT